VGSRVTIKDIARDLGVSYATVSLALNDAPGVNEETRRRIKEYARQVRYRPNASARAISTGRTHLVAVILGRLTDSFFEEIVQGVENVAIRFGYDVIVNTIGAETLPENEVIERLISRHIDGLIGTAYLSPTTVRRLSEVGIPTLLLRPVAVGAQPYVAVDDLLGGQIAAQHLVDRGHRRVLFVGDDSPYGRLRAEGARQILTAHGGQLALCSVAHVLDGEGAYEHLRARLRENPDFTAVFCASDVLAVGVYRALREEAVAIPEQMSVVGFDDLRWTRLLTPPLTTVHQPQVSQGETAMQMLVDLMEGREVESRMLQPRLVVRESTGPVLNRCDDHKLDTHPDVGG